MLPGRRLRVLAVVGPLLGGLGAAAAPRQALAQGAPARDVHEARRHFERARRDYGQGDYRDALAELQAAHALDPTAKDLVFNLGVVEEKLSDIDEALVWFHAYTTMTLTPQERERAEAYIHRLEGALEGAKKELERGAPPAAIAPEPSPEARPSPPEARPSPPEAPATPEAPAAPARGRVDAATIAAAGVAAAGLAFGTVTAIEAEHERPPSGFVTGVDGSYADLADRTRSAHRDAVFADVGFGASLAAGVVAAVLYFARERSAPDARTGGGAVTVSGGPVAGGAAIVVRGAL